MDVLADVLKTMRLRTNTYFCSDFSGDWGMQIPAGGGGLFHAVIDGECWLKLGSDDALVRLVAGDVIAFPTGGAHMISNQSEGNWLPGSEVVARIQADDNPFNDGAYATTLLCGSFEYDASLTHPFFKELPCFIHIKSSENTDAWLHGFVQVLASELRDPKPGSQVLIDRLTEILFVQLMRSYVRQHEGSMRYMSALLDPKMGMALSQIHNDDTARLNVEILARSVAMSRTSFTDHFTRAVGVSPKNYMISWRMQKARTKLQTSNESMISISEAAGYSSEAAFSKAYKQFFGQTPGASREVK